MWAPAHDPRPLYLTVEGEPQVGARVVVSHYPVPWQAEPAVRGTDALSCVFVQTSLPQTTLTDSFLFRIRWPGSKLVMALVKDQVCAPLLPPGASCNVDGLNCDDRLSSRSTARTIQKRCGTTSAHIRLTTAHRYTAYKRSNPACTRVREMIDACLM